MYSQQDLSRVYDGAITLVRKGWCQFADGRDWEGEAINFDDQPRIDEAEAVSIETAFCFAARELGHTIRFPQGYWDIDPDLWSVILRSLDMTAKELRAYNDTYALYLPEVVRTLERGKANIPSLGLIDENDCQD